MSDRLNREREFYDACNRHIEEYGAGKYYTITRAGRACFRRWLTADVVGRRVLEYGCGPGSCSFELARRGAIVTGIDISDEAIRRATEKAAREGLANASFAAMNAEALTFADDSFDLICGIAILHHLSLTSALAELARTLRPGGRAVFIEPLGHNPLINLYRRLTPELRTPDEHPLRAGDLRLARRFFGRVEVRYFHLCSLLAVPLRRSRWFVPTVRRLDRLDQALLAAWPALGRYCWTCVIRMEHPLKTRLQGLSVGVAPQRHRGRSSGASRRETGKEVAAGV